MYVEDALKNKQAELYGWVAEKRDLGKVKFILLRDKTGTLQILLKDVSKEIMKEFDEIDKEDYIYVYGKVVDSKIAKAGKELIPSKLKIISKSEQPLPIDISGKIETDLSKRLDWRFIDMRRPEVLSIFKVQSEIVKILSNFLVKNKFTRIFTSKLVNAPTEGGADYFEVKYFKKKAYLAQSPQFYKELALLSGLDKVFEIGMVYRAEPHHTTRHLCEYTSLDLEMVSNNMEEIMSFEEKMLRHLFKELTTTCKKELELHKAKLNFPNKIPRVKFDEAKKIVESMGIKTEEGDLTPAGERALCDWCKKKHDSDFVFLTHFPWKHKVFYAKRNEDGTSESFDLLYRGVEITTGGLREENYEKRKQNAIDKGINPNQFDHLRFFKYGMPPHGGLAIGIERLTMQILGLENIREASMTPRDPDRLIP